MTEEEQERLLSAWLAEPPGTPAPEGLPPEVLAAVVLLRPDRAPAPRVSLDEVLQSVTTGPFAAGQTAAAGEGSVVALRPRQVRRWWAGAALGGVLAAAAALLFVVPMAGRQAPAPSLAEREGQAVAPASPVLREPSPQAATPEPRAIAEASTPQPEQAEGRREERGRLESLGYVSGPDAGGSADAPTGGAASARPTATLDRDLEPAEDAAVAAEPMSAPDAGIAAPAPTVSSTAAPATPPPPRPEPAAKEEAEQAPARTATGWFGGDEQAASDELDDAEAPVRERKKDAGRRDTIAEAVKPASKATQGATRSAPAAASPAPTSGPGAGGTSFDPSFYQAFPDVMGRWEEALAQEAAGDRAAAEAAFATLMADARSEVAAEAACHVARLRLQAGDYAGARQAASAGQARASGVYLKRLLAVQKEILAAEAAQKASDAGR
jgi:hypothetical protein